MIRKPRAWPSKWNGLAAGGFFFVAGAMENGVWPVLLPSIAADFEVSVSAVVWVLVAFALGMAGTSLASGHIADVLGHKRVSIVGFVVETLALLLIVLVPVFWLILPLRFIQGMGRATGLNAIGALVVSSFPSDERGRILGIRNSLSSGGMLLGPLYGGLVGGFFDWRLALAGIVFLYGIQLLLVTGLGRTDRPIEGGAADKLRRLDWIGAVTFMAGMAAFLLAAQSFRGDHAMMIGPAGLAVAVVMFALTARFEGRSPAPVLNLGLLRSGSFSWAVVALVLFFTAFGATVFLFPFFMQQGLLWSVAVSGAALVAINVMQVWASPLTGALADRVGPRRVQAAGAGCMVGGLIMASQLGAGAGLPQVVLALLIIGGGMALFSPPNNRIIYDSVPSTSLGAASAATAVGRHVGTSLGGALGASLLMALPGGLLPAFSSAMLILAAMVGLGAAAAVLAPVLLGGLRS